MTGVVKSARGAENAIFQSYRIYLGLERGAFYRISCLFSLSQKFITEVNTFPFFILFPKSSSVKAKPQWHLEGASLTPTHLWWLRTLYETTKLSFETWKYWNPKSRRFSKLRFACSFWKSKFAKMNVAKIQLKVGLMIALFFISNFSNN